MGDRDGKKGGAIRAEIGRAKFCLPGGPSGQDLNQGFAVAAVKDAGDFRRSEEVNVGGQRQHVRPIAQLVDGPRGPIDLDAHGLQALELLGQEHQRRRASANGIHKVAGQEQKVDSFLDCGIKHPLRRPIRRLHQRRREMVRHLGQPERRPLQMKVAGMQKPKRTPLARLPLRGLGGISRFCRFDCWLAQ